VSTRQLKPIEKLKAEVKNYCSAEFRPPKPKPEYALPMIASMSCANCTKPHVV
jgi:hypothetical protein